MGLDGEAERDVESETHTQSVGFKQQSKKTHKKQTTTMDKKLMKTHTFIFKTNPHIVDDEDAVDERERK